ncbi:Heat shock protein 15 [Roseovarius sp. THAF9]|uniref:RNA-binding S4 domain-containing protein n=1 Tax=Roseovarius sp. THAF9 TaxID=2587847 RepID=UPI0012694E51|nr:RNA-binding S4 domain-containing protein [Roseovarius sp. THAF9]QFT93720.1 Heat shock protein 15 [Roseovarius sp. THAF9]
MSDPGQPKIRLDKWLWHARFFKTRSLATKLVTGGHMRVNAQRVSKASASVRPGDVLTFPKERDIRVIRILAVGERRGPAPEAQALYDDLDPPKPRDRLDEPYTPRYEGKGRPTKKDRRKMDRETRS